MILAATLLAVTASVPPDRSALYALVGSVLVALIAAVGSVSVALLARRKGTSSDDGGAVLTVQLARRITELEAEVDLWQQRAYQAGWQERRAPR